jgi:hypothetical protein
MHREPLDLRSKTMTELMAMDAEIGNKLDQLRDAIWQHNATNLLADRRQIRQELFRRIDDAQNDGTEHTIRLPR